MKITAPFSVRLVRAKHGWGPVPIDMVKTKYSRLFGDKGTAGSMCHGTRTPNQCSDAIDQVVDAVGWLRF